MCGTATAARVSAARSVASRCSPTRAIRSMMRRASAQALMDQYMIRNRRCGVGRAAALRNRRNREPIHAHLAHTVEARRRGAGDVETGLPPRAEVRPRMGIGASVHSAGRGAGPGIDFRRRGGGRAISKAKSDMTRPGTHRVECRASQLWPFGAGRVAASSPLLRDPPATTSTVPSPPACSQAPWWRSLRPPRRRQAPGPTTQPSPPIWPRGGCRV